MALVDDRAVAVDAYRANTGDNGFRAGHFYHAKAPGGAFLGVVPYGVYRLFAPRPPFEPWDRWSRFVGRALYVVTCFTAALWSAAAGVILFRLTRDLFESPSAAFGAVVLYAFATNVFVYSANFEAYALAASFLALGFYLVSRARRAPGGPSRLNLATAGLCLGFAVITEFQDLPIVLGLVVYLLAGMPRRRRAAWLIPGGLPPVVLVMLYNTACFGSPLSIGYAHQWGPWEALHRGALLGFGPPRLGALAQLLVGPRIGWFVFTPAVLLAIPGAVVWWRAHRHRAEWVLSAAVCVLFPVYLSGFGNVLSGLTFGPRFLVAALPFVCVLTAPAVARWPRFSAGVGAVSGLVVLAAAAVGPEVAIQPPTPAADALSPAAADRADGKTGVPIVDSVFVPFFLGRFAKSRYGYEPVLCPRPIQYAPFNVGMVVGLRWHGSLLPYLAWWAGGFFGIRRLLR